MIQINPREVATQALLDILQNGGYSNITLKRLLRQNGAMPQKDRGFVTEIVNGTLRNITYIDAIINDVSTVKTVKMKPWILAVIRSAVYQMYFMKVPDSAACDEAVDLVKRKGFGKLAGFTNGVLRNIARNKETLPILPENQSTAERLSTLYSHPLWILHMWLNEFDKEFVEELCKRNNIAPNVTIVSNPLKISTLELKKELEKCNITVSAGNHWENALHISKTADISALPLFQKGYFHVQDESSMTAVEVLDPKPGEKILDMCAAPGGKSFLIAEKMQNKGEVISRDIHEHKLELICQGSQRLGISILKPQCKDASQTDSLSIDAFDKVLVDAPCSGIGLIRKKPDIRLKKDGTDMDNLMLLQRKILEQAAKYVKNDGILVYSTCTICKKENQKNVELFLTQHKNYILEDCAEYLPISLKTAVEKEGWIRLFPQLQNTDGFFIARMRRKD